MDALTSLTDEQLKVVLCEEKLILVNACPGSGKTKTLVERAHLLCKDPEQRVLIVTFSTKAANEFLSRLDGAVHDQVRVCTIHKLGLDLLRRHWQLVKSLVGGSNWPDQPLIACKAIELELLREFDGRQDPLRMYDLVEHFRQYKAEPSVLINIVRSGLYITNAKPKDLLFWKSYEAYRVSRGVLTFEDMVRWGARIMGFPEVSGAVGNAYEHLMVDEAQDTDPAQWDLLRPIMGMMDTSTVVYDHNQAIYGWRGADSQSLFSLGLIEDSTKFSLSRNFRSGLEVAACANTVCPDKKSVIHSVSRERGVVNYRAFETPEQEVQWVISNAPVGSALIARTNSYLEAYERQLITDGRTYRGRGFYRQVVCQKMADTLVDLGRDVTSPESLLKIVQKMYVDDKSLDKEDRDCAQKALKLCKTLGVEDFVDTCAKSLELDEDGLTLTTGHASKGLEWPVVYVVGCAEGQCPHKLSTDMEEERRLLYVMVSRAQHDMHISWVGQRSRFLTDEVVGENLVRMS